MIQCAFENQNKAFLRHVGANIILVKGNEVLLVKRAERLVCGGMFGVIGGYVERNEDIIQAAKRECLEETGYTVHNLQLFSITDNPNRLNDERQNIIFTYIAEPVEQIGQPDDESTEVRWFHLDNLPTESLIAFDHAAVLGLYKKYLHDTFSLPVFVSK